jgi:hypothetical protein
VLEKLGNVGFTRLKLVAAVRNEEELNNVSVKKEINDMWKTQKKPLEDESCIRSE